MCDSVLLPFFCVYLLYVFTCVRHVYYKTLTWYCLNKKTRDYIQQVDGKFKCPNFSCFFHNITAWLLL